jgi:hypothetical protein
MYPAFNWSILNAYQWLSRNRETIFQSPFHLESARSSVHWAVTNFAKAMSPDTSTTEICSLLSWAQEDQILAATSARYFFSPLRRSSQLQV